MHGALTAVVAPEARLLTKEQAAAYCGQTIRSFDRLRNLGRLPNRVDGTLRWDRRALDLAIDDLSRGAKRASAATAVPEEPTDPLEAWRKKRDDRRNRGR